uniref:HTH cro/C1-type domain-containing protein n=1 Tax=mine drainage metagenome TaxID=410659 RepID=E6QWT0_9ZZZZ
MAGRGLVPRTEAYRVAKVTTLGLVLRAARLEAGLSTRDLERATGISNGQISKVEGGVRPDPSFRTIMRLANGIGISLDDLVARMEGRASPASAIAVAGRAKALASLERAKIEHERSGKALDEAARALEGVEANCPPKK